MKNVNNAKKQTIKYNDYMLTFFRLFSGIYI